jgi:hypothetical protein
MKNLSLHAKNFKHSRRFVKRRVTALTEINGKQRRRLKAS